MGLVSVIIPFYNCEDLIEECIHSVQRQTWKELEMLCIDDGSTDQSLSKVKALAAKDSRIKLWEQENKGAGAARNFLMSKAAGKYMIFLDADDYWVDRDALERMVNLCEQHQVYACGSRMRLRTMDREEELEFYGISVAEMEKNPNSKFCYRDYQFDFGFTSFLFQRELLIQNHIVFPEFRRYEDPPFLAAAMFLINDFVIADCVLYCYRASNAGKKIKTADVTEMAKGLVFNLNFARQHGLTKLFERTRNHLEYEQCRLFLQVMNAELLTTLLEANEIVRKFSEDDRCVIRPLETMLRLTRDVSGDYENSLLNQIEKEEEIVIFGAGIYGKSFVRFLQNKELKHKIKYILVSEGKQNPNQIEGIEVIGSDSSDRLDEIQECWIYVAAGSQFYKEIEDGLKRRNLSKIELMDSQFLYEISC